MEKEITRQKIPFWRNIKVLNIFWQVLFVILVVAVIYFFIQNAINGLNRIGLKFGFSFLSSSANFPIGEKILEYSPTNSYQWALFVGFTNTLKVTIIGIFISTILGIVMGIARLSNNWLARSVSGVYVEIFRNTPVLVQIFIWYFAVFLTLPRIQDVTPIMGMYFSNRGLVFPWFSTTASIITWLIVVSIALFVGRYVWKKMMNKQLETGINKYPTLWFLGCIGIFALLTFILTKEGPVMISRPEIEGVRFIGGLRFTPEFAAILFGLVFYTASYITEIVRGGILSVQKGQIEAAKALGLSDFKILRFITFPQAIRTIIPPVTSQYLNLAKNSSLAVAVGYPDLFSVGNTVLNQSGKAIEVILIMLIVYLSISLITSLIMNIYNNATRLVER
ncbi:amino acid ABC transporter permease [Anaerobacillus alkalidiazotrophicus]|uniref:Amino acid ABC transporter permease n=1 Tax=Anaerobacillus alkalidiazotrophicus TaxID=472963 RepID=A0A1S2M2T2_9BACI|nr:ABC transporter permease subunit [Anaerobacillus alkalidiazotrophicus]OIJ18733.1 amino acid ABC transporter permease [Anaerobacillus alkalidiazotrophicus]